MLDGTKRTSWCPAWGDAAAAAGQWAQLCGPTAAVLEARVLLRPFRNGCAWNPADERCDAFRIGSRPVLDISAALRPSHDGTTSRPQQAGRNHDRVRAVEVVPVHYNDEIQWSTAWSAGTLSAWVYST
ncbi:hypothetical protein ABT369_57850 [Dactylosporangium sp. NPDC000244]|uniref:hypothetical protein n=1 Tax=Dactylosporangium sp. NPDC000244 TaxID=3154365 RepID=UPI0033330DB7